MESNQKEIFLSDEGNQWFLRNKDALSNKTSDPIIDLMIQRQLKVKNVLEIGCSDGWRLSAIQELFKSECYGLDPSSAAIEEGLKKNPSLNLKQGTADKIPFLDTSYDLIIFGFCLYLCDRKDLFKIIYEADKSLNDNGYIVILDFEPSFPYKNKYTHKDGLYSYKMDYSDLFLSNPSYFLVAKSVFTHYGFDKIEDPNERVSVTLLMKNSQNDYILNPF